MSSAKNFSRDDAVREYLVLMHELAIRIDHVAHACEGKLNLTPPYAREYAYLQFRRICELIALGALHLHGDLPETQTNAARKEWNAEKIMRLLHRSHPHCFPQAAIREKTSNGWSIRANSKPNALSYDQFRTLYSECGEVLHRGTIRSIHATIDKADYQRLIEWSRKIADLMNEHVVVHAKGAGLYLISLRTTSGFPECSIFWKNESGGMKVATRTITIA